MSKVSKIVMLVFLITGLFGLILYSCIANNSDYVGIGNQKWMAKNLEVSVFRNGDSIPEAHTLEEWNTFVKQHKPAWCYYKFEAKNGKQFGKLYNGYAAMDSRGLAPIGWHLPNYDESLELINYVGGEKVAGTSLMSAEYLSMKAEGKNASGFTAMPGGWFNGYAFDQMGWKMLSWTCTNFQTPGQIYVLTLDQKGSAYLAFTTLKTGNSVRCIKD